MKIAFIGFTKQGTETCLRMVKGLQGHQCECYGKGSFTMPEGVIPLQVSLFQWTEDMFSEKEGLVFTGATGIAVRGIAPFIKDKCQDPAVLAVDELGNYVIPLLSGHIGGSNELAGQIAKTLNALAVITTGTDLNRRFAVDQWAKKNHMTLSDMQLAKQVSANLLQNKTVGFFTGFPVEGSLPEGLVRKDCDINIEISIEENITRKNTLQLIPRVLVLGIGCRKGTEQRSIDTMVKKVLRQRNISMKAVKQVASIDLKKEEPGLLSFCKGYDLPFHTYSAVELATAPGDFTESAFVNSVTGVDNVCERAAVTGSRGGKLLMVKQTGGGVTVALALEKGRKYKWT